MDDDRSGSALLSAIAPAITGVIGLVVFVILAGGPSEMVVLMRAGGYFGYAAVPVAMLATIATCVLAFLIARGAKVPLAVVAGTAIFPWLVGLGGTFAGMSAVSRALGVVDPGEAGLLFAVGTGEAFSTRAMGCGASAALLAGVALSLVLVRRTQLYSAAAVAAGAALLAGGTAVAVVGISRGLSSAMMASPADRALLVAGLLERAALARTVTVGAGALLVALVLLHVVLAAGGSEGGARIAGGVALAVVVVSVPILDQLVDRRVRAQGEALSRPFWSGVGDFSPIVLDVESAPSHGRVHVVVTRQDVRIEGEPARTLGDPGLADALAKAAAKEERPLMLGFDARASAPVLRQVLAAAEKAGVSAVALAGTNDRVPDAALQALGEDALFLRLLGSRPGGFVVRTGAGMSPDEHALDPSLLHAEVSSDRILRVDSRPGAPIEPFTLRLDDPAGGSEHEGVVVRLSLSDGATAQDLARAAGILAARGMVPMVVLGEMPGHPNQPLGSPEPPVGEDAPSLAMGSLEPAAIRRAIQGVMRRVRLCYEKQLAKRPTLSGKLVVGFTIQADGRVAGARADESMGDAEVDRCVVGALASIRFPRPRGGVVSVRYPFIFQPG